MTTTTLNGDENNNNKTVASKLCPKLPFSQVYYLPFLFYSFLFLTLLSISPDSPVRERGYPQLPIVGLDDCCDDKRSKVVAIVRNLRLRLQLKDPALIDGNIEALFRQLSGWTGKLTPKPC